MIPQVRRHRATVNYDHDLPSPTRLQLQRHGEVIDRDAEAASTADAWEAEDL